MNSYRLDDFNTTSSTAEVLHSANELLDRLSEIASQTTYYSYKSGVEAFLDWLQSKATEHQNLPCSAALYLSDQLANEIVNIETAAGRVGVLSNLIAFVQRRDPELVCVDILERIADRARVAGEKLAVQAAKDVFSDSGPSGASAEAVNNLILFLRQCRFGTRTHCYVELILATKARPRIVRQVNLPDIDTASQAIEIGISDDYLVGQHNLLETRTTDLSDLAFEALNAFIRDERVSPKESAQSPVFTTPYGRASSATLRRSVHDAGEALAGQSNAICGSRAMDDDLSPSDYDLSRPIQPSDIWWFSISPSAE